MAKKSVSLVLNIAVDPALGLIAAVLIMALWGGAETFAAKFGILFAGAFFGIVPDLDFVPYLLFRKKYGWTSHQLWHYPIIFIGMSLLVRLVFGAYWGMIFLAATLAHIMHDARERQGIRLMWPLYNDHIRWEGLCRLVNSQPTYNFIHASLRKGMENRSFFGEFAVRGELAEKRKAEVNGSNAGNVLLIVFACIISLFFLLTY